MLKAGTTACMAGISQSSNRPPPTALRATASRYRSAVRRPNSFQTVVMVAGLLAGPEIRKASAAPGAAPAWIRPAAIGTEADAQT